MWDNVKIPNSNAVTPKIIYKNLLILMFFDNLPGKNNNLSS